MNILDIHKEEISRKFSQGTSLNYLCEEYKVAQNTMFSLLAEMGLVKRKYGIPEEKQKEILYDYEINKMSYKDVSKKYEVSVSWLICFFKEMGAKRQRNMIKYINSNFFNELNKNNLWVLGWMYSDGNVCKNPNKGKFSIHVHSRDEEVLIKIKNLFGIKEYPIYNRKNQDSKELDLADIKIKNDLIKLGCVPNKSLIIKYPNFFTEDWQHWSFLRGVWDGDGHISIKSDGCGFNCELASGSLDFLESIQQLLKEKLNIPSTIYLSKQNNGKRLCIAEGKKNIITFLDTIYENGFAEYYLDRKFKTYLQIKRLYETKYKEKYQ